MSVRGACDVRTEEVCGASEGINDAGKGARCQRVV